MTYDPWRYISNSTFDANKEEIRGTKNLIKGSDNYIQGSLNKIVGDRNQISGENNTIIGSHNSDESLLGGKLFVSGNNNVLFVTGETEISLHGHANTVEFDELKNTHFTVHGFVTGKGADFAGVIDDKVSFSYRGGNTLMSLDTGHNHSDVLFTNAHVTKANVYHADDEPL